MCSEKKAHVSNVQFDFFLTYLFWCYDDGGITFQHYLVPLLYYSNVCTHEQNIMVEYKYLNLTPYEARVSAYQPATMAASKYYPLTQRSTAFPTINPVSTRRPNPYEPLKYSPKYTNVPDKPHKKIQHARHVVMSHRLGAASTFASVTDCHTTQRLVILNFAPK